MQANEAKRLAHWRVLGLMILSVIVAFAAGFLFAASNANQGCKEAFEQWLR